MSRPRLTSVLLVAAIAVAALGVVAGVAGAQDTTATTTATTAPTTAPTTAATTTEAATTTQAATTAAPTTAAAATTAARRDDCRRGDEPERQRQLAADPDRRRDRRRHRWLLRRSLTFAEGEAGVEAAGHGVARRALRCRDQPRGCAALGDPRHRGAHRGTSRTAERAALDGPPTGPTAVERNALVPVVNAANTLQATLDSGQFAPPGTQSPAAANIANDAAMLDTTARSAKLSCGGRHPA